MTPLFADTFFWLAYLNPRDSSHSAASEWLDQFDGTIITTEWVLVEVADAMSDPKNRSAFVEFVRALRSDTAVSILDEGPDLRERGFELFANRPDKKWSLTDCISFTAMTEHGIQEALTGDHHFEQAGFVAIFK